MIPPVGFQIAVDKGNDRVVFIQMNVVGQVQAHTGIGFDHAGVYAVMNHRDFALESFRECRCPALPVPVPGA